MFLRPNLITIAGLICAASGALLAQSFSIDGHSFQVHGFASQGFGYSNDNNYLTMKTSNGSFAMTEGGANISTSLTDKFRVGVQVSDRNLGVLGNWHPVLDWAQGDYKFKDWFGVRAGKVKTVFGLYNDTQDMEFLHTWALLPQSVYPSDLRANTISHTGGDVYGEISLHKAGSVSYTAFIGARTNDTHGGFYQETADSNVPITSLSGRSAGFDLRLVTPVQGLTVGTSFMDQTVNAKGVAVSAGRLPYGVTASPQHITSVYGDYSKGHFRFNGEFRRNYYIESVTGFGPPSYSNASDKEFFLSAAYRATKWLEFGAYNSRFYIDAPSSAAPAADHIFDQTVTARFDVNKFWNVKVEGHFIDGYGDQYSAHGFYSGSNPAGLQPKTNLLVVRTGFNF